MKNIYLVATLGFSLALTGCNDKQQDPKVGEYGQVKIASVKLDTKQISEINSSAMPKPDPQNRPQMTILYELDAKKNPYRFVTVVKGTAIDDGEVKLRLFGGTSKQGTKYKPDVFQHPEVKYKANEPVTLVLSSDPFSGNAKDPQIYYYQSTGELSVRENIKVSSVELQIWQGQGSSHSWVSYLKFLAIFLILFALAYRAYSVLVNAR